MDPHRLGKAPSLPVGCRVWFITDSWQSDSEMKLKTTLRDTEGPSMHCLCKGLSLSTGNIVFGCLPQGPSPT